MTDAEFHARSRLSPHFRDGILLLQSDRTDAVDREDGVSSPHPGLVSRQSDQWTENDDWLFVGLLLDFNANPSEFLVECLLHLLESAGTDVLRVLIQPRDHPLHRIFEKITRLDVLDV